MRSISKFHNSSATISVLLTTGMSRQLPKLNLMEVRGLYLWEKLLVAVVSSTAWFGTVATRMTITPGKLLGMMAGLGMICSHTSRR
jgi:hypothetical protein